MAAIGRRALLCTPLWGGPLLRAAGEARAEIVALLGDFASDLSSDNANGILKRVSPAMPERELFERHVRALLASAQVASSVEVREFAEEGAGRARATLDWFLEMRRDGFNNVLTTQRRRQLVKCVFEKQGKRWLFGEIQPVEFFAPPAI